MYQITNKIYNEQNIKREGSSRDRCNYSKTSGYYPGFCINWDEPCMCWSNETTRDNIDCWKYMCIKSMREQGFSTELEARVFRKREILATLMYEDCQLA
jgi:hypothetical protein